MRVERLSDPTPGQLDALTDLWEASVRATHHFLCPADMALYRRIVRSEALPAAELYAVRDAKGFAAFMGIAGDKIEMLFVVPGRIGQGLGRRLVTYAVETLGARRVDVNEQNTRAAEFYTRMGFRVASREERDPSGKPYPVLHLELSETDGERASD